MKTTLAVFLILFVGIPAFAVTVNDVVRLTHLKTKDEVIIDLLQKEGLERNIASGDVVYLKEKGVSDRVIRYMLQLSDKKQAPLAENMRSYSATTRDGKPVRIYTNLDERGKRIGGEVPPSPQQPEPPVYQSVEDEPRDVRVVVEMPPIPQIDPQQYSLIDRYNSPNRFVEDYFPYGSGYYPYFPYWGGDNFYGPGSGHHGGQGSGNDTRWHADAGYGGSHQQRPQSQRSGGTAKPASGGTRGVRRQ